VPPVGNLVMFGYLNQYFFLGEILPLRTFRAEWKVERAVILPEA
jgi:hypothetical protein